MAGRLEGRCAVVTGAAGNLGTAVCSRLLREGAKVLALVHRDSELAPLGAALLTGGTLDPKALEVRRAELSEETSVEAAYDAAEQRFGPLFAAAHCAGTWAGARIEDTTVEVFERMLAVNLRSAFLCSRAAVRRMARHGEGRIVNVAAYTAAMGVGNAKNSAYAASKAGVIALTRAVAEENAARGIRASCIAPGVMRTPMNASAMPGADQAGWVPLEDAANAILFLLSPEAGATTGAVVTLPSK